ncbi:MAG: AAA family ATPase, partial [Pseudonocardiaceae bacterium]
MRSVKQQELTACGNFNVLIGKNNSGKSNILLAIAKFFVFLSRDSLATSDSTFRSDDDYFERNTSEVIRVRATINVGEEILQAVFADIGGEFPQVQQALPETGPLDYLIVEVDFQRSPSNLDFLQSVYYQACDPVSGEPKGKSRMLIEVSNDAAAELAARERENLMLSTDIRTLENRNFDSDDFSVLKGGRNTPYAGAMLREPLSRQRLYEFQKVVDRAQDATQFLEMLEELLAGLRAQRDQLQTDLLSNGLATFSGRTEVIPTYVQTMLRNFADFRVLQLADRRRPIGSEEAGRLLQLKMSRGGGGTLKSIQQTVDSLLGVEIDAFASARLRSAP